jgi:hypothetical protein
VENRIVSIRPRSGAFASLLTVHAFIVSGGKYEHAAGTIEHVTSADQVATGLQQVLVDGGSLRVGCLALPDAENSADLVANEIIGLKGLIGTTYGNVASNV